MYPDTEDFLRGASIRIRLPRKTLLWVLGNLPLSLTYAENITEDRLVLWVTPHIEPLSRVKVEFRREIAHLVDKWLKLSILV